MKSNNKEGEMEIEVVPMSLKDLLRGCWSQDQGEVREGGMPLLAEGFPGRVPSRSGWQLQRPKASGE